MPQSSSSIQFLIKVSASLAIQKKQRVLRAINFPPAWIW